MSERLIEPDGFESSLSNITENLQYDPHYEISSNAYAWGKTARLLTESELLSSLSATDGPFYALDLCSSYPYYRQMMIGRHRDRVRERSRETVGSFVDQV